MAQAKLRAELDAADLSFPASFAETRDLPYLDAVIKEGLRMHPPVGNILERVVPSPGLALRDGRVIAPGTIVGMNQWVVSRAKETYGDDADVFRPERWLRGDDEAIEAYEARLKMMKDGDLGFGGGNRICTGRHMATIEMFKVTATLFSRYDVSDKTPANACLLILVTWTTFMLKVSQMELEDPSMEWTIRLWWFIFTKDIRVKITRRLR